MTLRRLVVYLALAAWTGGLGHGATDLALEGRWTALIPAGLFVAATVALVVAIRRDYRRGAIR